MRREPNCQSEKFRIDGPPMRNTGAYLLKGGVWREPLRIIASDGGGWDHVSVSTPRRCPTWDEMAAVKDLFFAPEEAVMQLHPPKSDYINLHPYCLHLWRPQTTEEITDRKMAWMREGEAWPDNYPFVSVGEIPLPPSIFVGLKSDPLRHYSAAQQAKAEARILEDIRQDQQERYDLGAEDEVRR